MECSEISFLRSHSEQIPQKNTILGSRNFWKRIRWDYKEPYEMIAKLDIRPVLFILHYFFIFCWVLSMGHKVRCNQCSLIFKSLLYLHQNSKGNLWLSGVQVIFTHFHFCENKMWVCMYVCVYLESLIGTRYLIWECGVVSKPPKNTAKAIWAHKFLVKCQASKNRVFGILKVNQRKNWLECKLCVIFFCSALLNTLR